MSRLFLIGFFLLFTEAAIAQCQSVLITTDSTVTGELQSGDCRVDDVLSNDDQSLVDSFEIQLASASRVTVDMEAVSLGDPFLRLLTSSLAVVAEDDDSGEAFNARVSMDLAPGSHIVLANSATALADTGSYRLTFTGVSSTASGGGGSTTGAPPVVTLNGAAVIMLLLGQNYLEQGATASDQEDGNITSSLQILGTVDTSRSGIYPVSYSVSDSSGQNATATRFVVVEPSAQLDTDGDGVADIDDLDDDNDGVLDIDELVNGRNPKVKEAILLTTIQSLLLL